MIKTVDTSTSTIVPPDELARREAEYRRLAFECQGMPHGVYQKPFVVCPWPGCGFRIVAVDFKLEKDVNPVLYSRAVSAFWQGPGIVCRCPSCGQFVLFSMGEKQQVPAPPAADLTVLPDDWHQQAYIVS